MMQKLLPSFSFNFWPHIKAGQFCVPEYRLGTSGLIIMKLYNPVQNAIGRLFHVTLVSKVKSSRAMFRPYYDIFGKLQR